MLWSGDLFPDINKNILLMSCFCIEIFPGGGREEAEGNLAGLGSS